MRAIHLIKKSVYMVTALIFYEINIEVSHKYTRLIFFINLVKDCFQVCFKFIKIAVRRSINCSYDDFLIFTLNQMEETIRKRLLRKKLELQFNLESALISLRFIDSRL